MELFQGGKWIPVGMTLKAELFLLTDDPQTVRNSTAGIRKIQAHPAAQCKHLGVIPGRRKLSGDHRGPLPPLAQQVLAAGESIQGSQIQGPWTLLQRTRPVTHPNPRKPSWTTSTL